MMGRHRLLWTQAARSELYRLVRSTAQMLSLIRRQEGFIQKMAYPLAWIHVGGATECQRSQTETFPNIRIRKLTPKECFRLQGWTDDYFEKAQFVNSDSQLYKQAGNGVTVTVIEAIARRFENDNET